MNLLSLMDIHFVASSYQAVDVSFRGTFHILLTSWQRIHVKLVLLPDAVLAVVPTT